MSKLIGIMGEPGSGKTSSLIGLNPKETFYIDCDGKGLNWKGWKKQYSLVNKNYARTSHPSTVLNLMQKISKEIPDIKVIVIDTLNNLMVSEEMRNCKVKGYDKWTDLAQSVWDIVDQALVLREDLTVIILFHVQTEWDEGGYQFTKIKTNGKKTERNNIDSKFNTLLYSKCINGEYIFETKANNSTARTPRNAFESETIPNDIVNVIEQLEEY